MNISLVYIMWDLYLSHSYKGKAFLSLNRSLKPSCGFLLWLALWDIYYLFKECNLVTKECMHYSNCNNFFLSLLYIKIPWVKVYLKRILSLTLLCRHPWAVTQFAHLILFSIFSPMLLWKILCYFTDNLKTTILHIVGTTVWHYQDYKAILSRGTKEKHYSFYFFLSLYFFPPNRKVQRKSWKNETILSTLAPELIIFFFFLDTWFHSFW